MNRDICCPIFLSELFFFLKGPENDRMRPAVMGWTSGGNIAAQTSCRDIRAVCPLPSERRGGVRAVTPNVCRAYASRERLPSQVLMDRCAIIP